MHRSSSVFTFSTKFPKKNKISLKKKLKAKHSKILQPNRYSLGDLHGQQKRAHAQKFALDQSLVESTTNQIHSNEQSKQVKSIQDFNLHPSIINAWTNEFQFQKLSQVQESMIPNVLHSKKHLLCASETGTGKTLAYLLPLFHLLKIEEEHCMQQLQEIASMQDSISNDLEYKIEGITKDGLALTCDSQLSNIRKCGRPRLMILVPSTELVLQTTAVAKQLSHYCRLRVLGLHSKLNASIIRNSIASSPVDVLISTPGILLNLMKDNTLGFNQLKWMVLDEADTLFDKNFSIEILKILQAAKASSMTHANSLRFFFVSATLPKSLMNRITTEFSPVKALSTPGLHRVVKRTHHSFLHIDQSTTKDNLLLDILKREITREQRIIVFCNTQKHCMHVATFLKSKEYNVLEMSSKLELNQRKLLWDRFKNSNEKDALIMVATDIASRGLDTTMCGHVILYDFPQTTIDYLHRAGRVGRMGRKGKVTSIISRKERMLAQSIEQSVKKGQLLSQ